MRARVPAVLALLGSLLLAGCSGGGADPDPALDADFEDLGLEATSTTGVIRGIVVDDAIKPVAGATVTLSGGAGTATTDEGGLFGFDDLPAQTYFLQVEKAGYRPTQQSADVVAGVAEPPIVKVLLQADASTLPYVVQHLYRGYIQCSFKVANIVFDAQSCDPAGLTGLSTNDDSSPWFAVTAKPTYYQSEMQWETTQATGAGLVTIQLACDEGDCGETDTNRLCNVRGHSPLTCRVTLNESSDGGEGGGGGHGIDESGLGSDLMGYTVSMYANCFECIPGTVLGLGVVLEQKFEVYNHLFYQYQPPEGWSFLVDGAPPSPPA
jgi:hypothetical protein